MSSASAWLAPRRTRRVRWRCDAGADCSADGDPVMRWLRVEAARGEEDVTVVLELGVARRTDIDGSSVQGTPVLVDVEDDEADGGGVFHEEQQGGGWR